MGHVKKLLMVGALVAFAIPAACNKETEFSTGRGMGDSIKDPLPTNVDIGSVEAPTKTADGKCVDANGNDSGAVLAGFPSSIEECVNNSNVSARGIFNFGQSVCEKIKFTKIACSKDSIRAEIVKGGMDPSNFDSYANQASTVFFEGGCGAFVNSKGERIVMIQFYIPPKTTEKECVYKVEQEGRFVTGCYIAAKDNSWASLNPGEKVARCFREAPR